MPVRLNKSIQYRMCSDIEKEVLFSLVPCHSFQHQQQETLAKQKQTRTPIRPYSLCSTSYTATLQWTIEVSPQKESDGRPF